MNNSKLSDLKQLSNRLEYKFQDLELFQMALTHRSASSENNERLEFLGDGLLNCIIAAELFRRCPNLPEGDLSRMRASLVRESTLGEVACELDIGACINLGHGEGGSHRRASVLADTYEAILGAIYVDSDFDRVQSVVLACFKDRLDNLPDPESLKDPKTRLQEYLQARSFSLPEYINVSATGPAHKRHFVVACEVPETDWTGQGEGASRRKAEQAAAEAILEKYIDV